ncbi:competence protein ComEA [Peptoclostridium litorale DSM 5388]|uniref:ComE operon protein 1 n=1 Tax=Peptoclostridium litorale DSM 5388 TaxID=1121324 RepID=A0A069RAM6_PEPLI|nr:ComE operon protein 1 [Peptoclostridium litorale DSM 5388]SIN80739.1 competence protein ComEA [Peptoclostridium litorale DSM 5388]
MEFKTDKNKMIAGLLVIIIIVIAFKNNSQREVHVISSEKESLQEKVQSEQETSEYDREPEEVAARIKVYVSGEVKNYGVIEMSRDARLVDAVEKLGGLTEYADVNRVNLAQRLEDGGHYIVPKIGENIDVQNEYQMQSNGANDEDNAKIDINTADAIRLKELPGIGDAIAQRIIEYREQNGKFKSIDQIKNVSGIGDKKFEGIRDMIRVE